MGTHRSATWWKIELTDGGKRVWWFPNPAKLVRCWRLHEVITFHDIRFQVIYYRYLPDKFRFSAFLRKIKAVTFIELVERHWSLWVIFLLLAVRRVRMDSGIVERPLPTVHERWGDLELMSTIDLLARTLKRVGGASLLPFAQPMEVRKCIRW